jgi:hypothetical protein
VRVEELHEALFGFRPDKPGTAYERLAAMVFAVLGWVDIRHDVREAGASRRTKHQLDVTAIDPSGDVRRLLVECKDWNNSVGKGTLDALVGVRSQLGADAAAVVTTKGFTKGARDVAADEDVAMVLLSPYDPDGDLHFVRKVIIKFDFYVPAFEEFDIELWPEHKRSAGVPIALSLTGADRFSYLDGTPAEQIFEVMQRHSGPLQEGRFPQRADFSDGRLLPTVDGEGVPIRALMWTVHNQLSRMEQVIEGTGHPMLVLQQLDEHGRPDSAQLFVDTDLHAWDIDQAGNVVPRGSLLSS